MRPLVLETATAEETMRLGALVAQVCAAGDIVALVGELGAGKTQFTRGLAQGLGLDGRAVSSPTFVTVQEYWPEDRQKPVLVHIDAWRMKGDGAELEGIGWGHDGADLRRGAVVAVEWPGRLGPALGADYLQVALAHAPGEKRRISLLGSGAWAARMQALADALTDAGWDLGPSSLPE